MFRQAYDEGVTEVIGFVLIIGLAAVVLLILALVVPPMNGAEIEGELTFGAVQDISDLKYDMDLLWENGTLPNATRSVLLSLSTPKQGKISMLPVLKPTIGSATLSAGVSDLNITINGTPYNNLLRLTYSTSNHYAADAVVVYDAGAVFVGTHDNLVMMLAPSVGKGDDGSMQIVLPVQNLINESSVYGNRFGVVEYHTVGIENDVFSSPNITVVSSNPDVEDAWNRILDICGRDEDDTYHGTVRVKTVTYSMLVRGAVPS